MSTNQNHPLDDPLYFGDGGEWIAVRGGIPKEEAIERIRKFDLEMTEDPDYLREIDPEEVGLVNIFPRDGDLWLYLNDDEAISKGFNLADAIEAWSHYQW